MRHKQETRFPAHPTPIQGFRSHSPEDPSAQGIPGDLANQGDPVKEAGGDVLTRRVDMGPIND